MTTSPDGVRTPTTWRHRSVVVAFANLPASASIRGHDVFFKKDSDGPAGEAIYVMDIAIEAPSATEGFFLGVDLADEAADRIAFLSYAATMKQTVSTTKFSVAVGEEFELAVPRGMHKRGRATVGAERFKALDVVKKQSPQAAALRSFRTGVSDPSPYHAVTDLWKSGETLAEVDAKARGYVASAKCNSCNTAGVCPSCGGPIGTRPHTHRAILENAQMISSDGPELVKKRLDEGRALRGAIVHGAHLADFATRQKALKTRLTVQPLAVATIARHIGVKTECGESFLSDVPLTVLRMIRTGPGSGDFQPFTDTKEGPIAVWECKVATSAVPAAATDGPRIDMMAGLTFPFPLDPLMLPD